MSHEYINRKEDGYKVWVWREGRIWRGEELRHAFLSSNMTHIVSSGKKLDGDARNMLSVGNVKMSEGTPLNLNDRSKLLKPENTTPQGKLHQSLL